MHAAGPPQLAGTQPALRRAARAGSCGAWLSPLPSSKRRLQTGVGVRARPWGSADGLTEKGTHGVQPGRPASRRRGVGGTEAAVAWGCRAPSRGALDVQNESPPRVGRPGTPWGLTARGLQQRGGPTAPRGAFAGLSTTTANIQSRSRRGRMLSVRVPAPLGPSSTTRRAQRSPGAPQATGAWGRHPGEAWPVRSQTGEGGTGGVPCRQGKGQQRQGGAASTHSQGRGSGAQALSREQKDRDAAGPTGKLARGPTVTHTRCFRDVWYAGWRPPPRSFPRSNSASGAVLPAAPPCAAEGPRPRKSSIRPLQIRLHLVRLKTHVLGTSSPARRPSPSPHTSSACGFWQRQA